MNWLVTCTVHEAWILRLLSTHMKAIPTIPNPTTTTLFLLSTVIVKVCMG